MIKAVIFDCFGVLTTDGWIKFKSDYLSEPEITELAIAANKRVDAGIISYRDFVAELSQLSGRSEVEVQNALETHVPNTQLLKHIKDTLQGHKKIGMLSNAASNWLDEMFEPWQVNLFDEVVLSYQLGVIKPDPVMYTTIANRLGVLPEEAIFIDDNPSFVEGARALGMMGIHHTDTDQTISTLQELLNA